MKEELMIQAHQLSKAFYKPSFVQVLKSIDLDVYKGESVAIIGKSGEGKSTLLHLLGTLEQPDSGTLEICGYKVVPHLLPTLRNSSIGFIFQNYHLLEHHTVLENVLMPAKIARSPTDLQSVAYKRAKDLLKRVGLENRASFPVKLLSGGERQRVAICRALCNDPPLLLADEPSGNLDHVHSQEIHHLLLDLTKELKKTLIVVTHDRELSSLCDKKLVLKDGTLSISI